MYQPSKWKKWGLLLIPLWVFTNMSKTSVVEADLTARSTAQIGNALDKGAVSVAGRDVTLNGAGFTEAGQSQVAGTVLAQSGVRKVLNSTTLIAEGKPYAWGATRDGNKITMTGMVPDPATRAKIADAAKAAVPGAEITDSMVYARGAAAAGVAGAAAFGLGELGLLTKGETGVSDGAFSIKGEAADAAKFLAAVKATSALPDGLKLAAADILPPEVKAYEINAAKTADGITLSGYAPSLAAQAKFDAAAKVAAPGGNVVDNLQIARGLPAGLDFDAVTGFMLAELGNLKTGAAKLAGNALSISGDAPSAEAFKAATGVLSTGLPAGVKLAGQGIVGPAPPPAPVAVTPAVTSSEYGFEAIKDANNLTLTGSYPDEDAHQKILNVVKAKFFGVTVVDQTKLAEGAPKNFVEATVSAVSQLGRLDTGAASISGTHILLKGEALYDNAAKQINSTIVTALPSGFVGESTVVTMAPQPVIEDVAKCQTLVSDLLGKGKIRFETGKATIHPDSFGFMDAVVANIGRCPTTKVEVGGHTDNVGDPNANQDLSMRRAQTTLDYLVKAGIPTDRLTAVGYGETKPVASNDTDEGKAQNRRIEFLVK